MTVASLELSKELFELSGWDGLYKDGLSDDTQNLQRKADGTFPLYDTDYLLEKLEPWMSQALITRSDDGLQWVVSDMDTDIETYASALRDAIAEYAIKLFKEGKLKREGK